MCFHFNIVYVKYPQRLESSRLANNCGIPRLPFPYLNEHRCISGTVTDIRRGSLPEENPGNPSMFVNIAYLFKSKQWRTANLCIISRIHFQ